MHAVIDDRNQQFRVTPGMRVRIPFLRDAQPGSILTFDKVCLVTGEQPQIGTPHVAGATVTAKVLGNVKGPKLIVAKYKRRKGYRCRTGARARFTEVQIESINS